MQIVVMGDGAWGSALYGLIQENKHKVSYWKNGQKLQTDSIVVGAIPTQAIREVLAPSKGVAGVTYINCAKGIEQKTHLLPYQIVTELLESPDYFTLIGPSFSEEVKQHMPTLVNLGYRTSNQAQMVKELFQTDYFRVKLTQGIRSLELAAAFKNIYAIACGITDGLGLGMNTRVKVMCIAMDEFNTLREKLDFKMDNKALPATIGDLILTCNSEESRNFSFGKSLVNNSVSVSLEKSQGTVEGYYTVESIPYFEEKLGISLPLARFVFDVTHKSSAQDIKSSFMNFVKTI